MKKKDVKELGKVELVGRVNELRREIFQLRIQKSVGTVENPLRIRNSRREVALALTLLRDLEIKASND